MQVPSNIQPGGNARGMYQNRFSAPPPPRPVFDSTPAPTLPGYYVSSEDDIIPGNVPMDGSISFFPSRDLSRIFIRQWNKQGDLEHLTYVLEPQNVPQQIPSQQDPQAPSRQDPPEVNVLTEALTAFNQGISNTFGQFSMTLQSMEKSLSEMNERIAHLPDGGMG